ncbi:MAG: hypothetical protein HFH50_08295 [Lachnospiraceae bacterium]|jgi:hypothetical protein|nr:hypothetical protein [Lachnospiraceae bacterium]MCI8874398.1 hypothetical protein [Lachnospiraceae bacterium]GFI31442.1 hypothetical protein IMSAGC013_02837 [Lachnospiraceae bacterium]
MTMTLFYGNYTYCATYAIFDSGIDVKEISKNKFEMLSSVPFGVVHGKEYAHRLISPVYEPLHGIKRACEILNKKYIEKGFDDKNDARDFLLKRLNCGSVVIGPVEMSKLNYIPLSRIYERVPHYISLYKDESNIIRVNDSEGIMGQALPIEEFMVMWDSVNLMESDYIYTVGYIESEGKLPFEKEQVIKSTRNCFENLEFARKIKQGPMAFEKLWETISNTSNKQYKNHLFFDLEIFIQRKYLMLSFIQWIEKYIVCNTDRIKYIVKEQIYLAAQINNRVRNGNMNNNYQLFYRLGILEDDLTNIFGEVCENACRNN